MLLVCASGKCSVSVYNKCHLYVQFELYVDLLISVQYLCAENSIEQINSIPINKQFTGYYITIGLVPINLSIN